MLAVRGEEDRGMTWRLGVLGELERILESLDPYAVHAGAGIVEASDSEAEYAETELKQLPLLQALGVEDV